jgi:hypothetical protein
MSDPVNLLAEVVNCGYAWVRARNDYRRTCDSKRATEDDQKKAGQLALKAADKLEKALIRLMAVSGEIPARKKNAPLDWGKLAGAIAKGAGVVEDVLKRKGPFVEVIDTEGREVK